MLNRKKELFDCIFMICIKEIRGFLKKKPLMHSTLIYGFNPSKFLVLLQLHQYNQ